MLYRLYLPLLNNLRRKPADNERFHASGGATRPTLCVEQLLAALVRALPNPRLREAATTLCASSADASS